MKITPARNATAIVEYGGKRFLTDPVLGDPGSFDPYGSLPGNTRRNPLVPLGLPVEELLAVDAVIATHLHTDHFDDAALELLPRDLPVFVQNEQDRTELVRHGFADVRVLQDAFDPASGPETVLGGVRLLRTPGCHGTNDLLAERAGFVCGVLMSAPGEPDLYLAGDTVWYEGVERTLREFEPGVVVVNAGGNRDILGRLIMDDADVLRVHEALPKALIVAVHMEDINHYTVTRELLRLFAEAHGFSDRLAVPENGQTVEVEAENPALE